jgi:pyridoxamine 5'-phosphate oxidase
MEKINLIVQQLRKEYSQMQLLESEAASSPFKQFELWFNQAIAAEVEEPHAMVLSTVNDLNEPDSRIVLLREFSEKGFGFFTNYTSAKGEQISKNNHVALNFFWPGLERQIRVHGTAKKQSEEKSDLYFNTRPEISRVGAWASPQSKEIKNRAALEELFTSHTQNFLNNTIKRPPFWGGYMIKPSYFEFWQGRPGRLHDRLVYELHGDFEWKIKRLAP